jgi:hypothetical protein
MKIQQMNLENNQYFKKYTSIIIEIDKNTSIDELVKLILPLKDYLYEINNITKITDYVKNSFVNIIDNFYYRFTYKNETTNNNLLRLSHSSMFSLEEMKNYFHFTYDKVYNLIDLKNGNILNLLKYGRITPTYQPKKFIREGINDDDINLNKSPYFKKYNSIAVKIKNGTPMHELINILSPIETKYVLKNFDLINFCTKFIYNYNIDKEIDTILILIYDEDTNSILIFDFIDIDIFDNLSIEYDYTYDKIYSEEDLKNGNIDSLIKYGNIKPNYVPRKLIRENYFENNLYFNKYKLLIIDLPLNTPQLQLLKLFNIFDKYYNGMFKNTGIDLTLSIYLEKMCKIYNFFISMDNEGIWLYSRMNNLNRNIDRNQYDKLYNINNLIEIELILKFGINAPNYNPRTLIREGLDDPLSVLKSNLYFKKYNSIVIKISYNEIEEFNNVLLSIKKYIDDNYEEMIKNIFHFKNDDSYIRLNFINRNKLLKITYNLMEYLYKSSLENGYTYDKVYDINDLKKGYILNIIKYGITSPTYSPRKIIRE